MKASVFPWGSVLVTDDDPASVSLLVSVLAPLSRVRVAVSGERALEICRSPDPPSVVLLDLHLAGLDGFEVCAHLKADPTTANIPVVFVTGAAAHADEERCVALGAADVMSKPVGVGLLALRVRHQLELVRFRQQASAVGRSS